MAEHEKQNRPTIVWSPTIPVSTESQVFCSTPHAFARKNKVNYNYV